MLDLAVKRISCNYYLGAEFTDLEVFFKCGCNWLGGTDGFWISSYCEKHGWKIINSRGEICERN